MPLRTLWVLSLALLATSLAAGAQQKAKVSLYQENRTTLSRDNQSQTVQRKIWIKHPGKVRMEETVGAQSRVTVSNGTDLWIALPSQKRGMHRKMTAAQVKTITDRVNVDLDMVPKFVKAGARKVKQERVNGVLCDVYRREKSGQLTQTLWVSATGARLAQRQEESGIIRAAEQAGQPMKTMILKTVTDYLAWKIDHPVADSLFVPPTGIKYQEALKTPANRPGAAPKRR